MTGNNSLLIEPKELAELLEKHKDETTPQLFILDGSWLGLPIFQQRDPKTEFDRLRIPRAHFFDIDECSDQRSKLPHMMPTSAHFQEYLANVCTTSTRSADGAAPVRQIDLTQDIFVVYDSIGIWSAPRVWWMLKVFGAQNAYILNGGICAWMAEGFAVDEKPHQQHSLTEGTIQVIGVYYNEALIGKLSDIKRFVQTPPRDQSVFLIDARPQGRFQGKEPEPRPDVPSGHIPGSHNIPWTSVLDIRTIKRNRSTLSGALEGAPGVDINYEYYVYKPREELESVFGESVPLYRESQLVFSCGSGVSAVVVLAAALLCHFGGLKNVALYDGSWVEWKWNEMGLL